MGKTNKTLIFVVILGLLTIMASAITKKGDHQSNSEKSRVDELSWRDYEYPDFWNNYRWVGQNSKICKNKCIAGQICVIPIGKNERNIICKSICGDGLLVGQQLGQGWCDDGNRKSGDGCYHCRVEANYHCSGAPSTCYKCGNGVIDPSENCDDGNTVSGDGCSSCSIDANYHCSGAPSACYKCGNGIHDPSEECDNGPSTSEDGCSNACLITSGWTCADNPSNNSICTQASTSQCGNNIVEAGEYCEAGTEANSFGCVNCQASNPYWTCTTTATGSSICTKSPYCGDSQLDIGEECDQVHPGCINCKINASNFCDCTNFGLYQQSDCICV